MRFTTASREALTGNSQVGPDLVRRSGREPAATFPCASRHRWSPDTAESRATVPCCGRTHSAPRLSPDRPLPSNQPARLVHLQTPVLPTPPVMGLVRDPSFFATVEIDCPLLSSTSASCSLLTICSAVYRLLVSPIVLPLPWVQSPRD